MTNMQKAPVPITSNRQTALMSKARASGSFDTFELTCLLWGGQNNVQQRRAAFDRVERVLGIHDSTQLPQCYSDTSREGIYQQGLRMGKAIFEDMQEHKHDLFVWITLRYNLINASPFGHQGVLFEPAIEHNGTEQQKAKWLSLARSGRILGTYCQTEIGHAADESVINSPTKRSAKFWPAGLGFSTTHAVVMAQLVVGKKHLGPHLFVVPIRSLQDGRPLPGIRMGDVGLKMAYNEADNGYATFDHIRIPRIDMLMGHSTLSRDGTYVADQNRAKLSYSVMLLVRSKMPAIFAVQLAQAVTIATRYSVVHEQGLGPDNALPAEQVIMDYKAQHFRILTLIAKSYAMFFAGQDCNAQYADLRARQDRGDHATLPSVHALCAGLKAYVTAEAADGAEEARKLCGGHGFMAIFGLPDLVGATAGGCTFEGENYVMWQQLGRYLLKQVDLLQAGKEVDEQVQYLCNGDDATRCSATDGHFLEPAVQLAIYQHRAQRLLFKTHRHVRSAVKANAETWNEHMMVIISASRAHIEYLVVQSFYSVITHGLTQLSPALQTVLRRLCLLFALSSIINPRSMDALSFIESDGWDKGYLTSSQLDTVRSLVNELLGQLLLEAIVLTDAWDFSDASLCSALGMSNGNVYETMMRWVEQMPINNGSVEGSWTRWVEPILKSAGRERAKL